jgi:hypothetical protein
MSKVHPLHPSDTSDGYSIFVEVKKLFIHNFLPVNVAKAKAYPATDYSLFDRLKLCLFHMERVGIS